MSNQNINFSEILISSLEAMISQIGTGVAKAQTELDKSALEFQEKILSDEKYEKLKSIGYIPNWYQMPQVDVELKVAVHFEENKNSSGTKKTGFYLSPFNAKYQNSYKYSADGASTLKLKIVPIPYPVNNEEKF